MKNGIIKIDFETILPIWKNELWPERISPIETHSAMLHLFTEYDIDNFSLPVWYHGYYIEGQIVGVNSGHLCVDGSARSRGLWVYPKFRKIGYGKELLLAAISESTNQDASSIWSFPRKASWSTYQSAGFSLTSNWMQSETSEANAYCYLRIA